MRSTDIDLDPPDADLVGISVRNRLRAESGLPLLSVEAERARLTSAREQAAFERDWQRRRSEFAMRWAGNGAGWVTNSARWAMARQQVREEMYKPTVENP